MELDDVAKDGVGILRRKPDVVVRATIIVERKRYCIGWL